MTPQSHRNECCGGFEGHQYTKDCNFYVPIKDDTKRTTDWREQFEKRFADNYAYGVTIDPRYGHIKAFIEKVEREAREQGKKEAGIYKVDVDKELKIAYQRGSEDAQRQMVFHSCTHLAEQAYQRGLESERVRIYRILGKRANERGLTNCGCYEDIGGTATPNEEQSDHQTCLRRGFDICEHTKPPVS